MNNKITISSLATLLSLKSGEPKKTCESFLREFFTIITDQIAAGDNVKVKGFGTFKVISVSNRKSVDVNTGEEIEIPGHKKIVFVPAKELAEEVNAPFSAFESVEVNPDAEAELDSLEIEQEIEPEPTAPEKVSPETSSTVPDLSLALDSTSEQDSNEPQQSAVESITGPEAEYENSAEPEPIYFIKDDETPASEKIEPEKTAQHPDSIAEPEIHEEACVPQEPKEINNRRDISPEPEEVAEAAEIREETETSEINKRRYGRGRFIWGFILGLTAASVFGFLLYFFMLQKMLTGPEHDIDMIVKTDSVAAVPTAKALSDSTSILTDSTGVKEEEGFPDTNPSDRIVYDTVTTKCYLTTLAKKYYGNYNLWPYIYEENKAILGHPDRITPGTRVVIPPLSKYGVDPKSQKDVNKAKKMGDDIYARYR